MEIKITKMQGCGNDFVLLDYSEFLKTNMDMSTLAKKLCHRNFGIGADGMIIPDPLVNDADIGWYFYNSDGTTAQMCGNGMRCFAKYVYDKKIIQNKEFSVRTLAGIIKPQILEDGNVRVNMSKPILDSAKIPFVPQDNMNYNLTIDGVDFVGSAISMGNPHFVIFVSKNDNPMALAKKYGALIETHSEFPEKTNVEFVKILSPKDIELAVWERGCGITLACGTGACASVVAGILNNYLEKSVLVNLPGGKVFIDWDGSSLDTEQNVYLTGPAEYSFVAITNI